MQSGAEPVPLFSALFGHPWTATQGATVKFRDSVPSGHATHESSAVVAGVDAPNDGGHTVVRNEIRKGGKDAGASANPSLRVILTGESESDGRKRVRPESEAKEPSVKTMPRSPPVT